MTRIGVAWDLRRGNTTGSREKVEQWCHELYFNADSVFVFSSLATRLGLFGTVIGIIAWFGGTTLHSPESISAVGYALSTTALGLVLATSIEMSVSRIFEPAWQEFCVTARRLQTRLESLNDHTVSTQSEATPEGAENTQSVSSSPTLPAPIDVQTAAVVEDAQSVTTREHSNGP